MPSPDIWELASAILVSIGGAAVILAGLATWVGKLWLKRILGQEEFQRTKELETIRAQLAEATERSKAALAAVQARESAELQHRTHVSKAQFDLEFKIYQDLWNKVELLRASSIKYWHPLKEAAAAGPLSQSALATAAAGQKQIAALYQELVEYYLSQSPFMSKSVKAWLDEHPELLAAINGVSKMALDAAAAADVAAFDDVVTAQRQINQLQTGLSDAIRERIASIAIVT